MSVAEYVRVGTFRVTRRQTIVVDHVCRWPISLSKDFAVVLYLCSISKVFLSQCAGIHVAQFMCGQTRD